MQYIPALPAGRTTVSTWLDPFILCGLVIGSYLFLSPRSLTTPGLAFFIVMIATVVMSAIEWRRVTPMARSHPLGRATIPHLFTAWLGAMAGLGLIALAWSAFPEYQLPRYQPFFHVLVPFMLVVAPVLCAIGIALGDRAFGTSMGGSYQLGLALRGHWQEVEWPLLQTELLSWLIRGFFLPTNFATLVVSIDLFRGKEATLLSGTWIHNEYFILQMLFALTIAVVTPGYIFGARFIRTEMKAVANSLFAWVVTLACYPPFWDTTLHWFSYYGFAVNPAWMLPWALTLQSEPFALYTVGAAIIVLTLAHLWGEAQFGIRSSNLSNRGIITAGPYRFCKHPVYVSKCAGWFLLWMPFLAGTGVLENIRLTILFTGICVIYGLRSLAEEKLLSADPVYVAYALRIDEHGMFRKIGHWIPPMSFRWRLAYWTRHQRLQTVPTFLAETGA